ncbi:MAG: urea transporter [Pannonibacter indicus]
MGSAVGLLHGWLTGASPAALEAGLAGYSPALSCMAAVLFLRHRKP